MSERYDIADLVEFITSALTTCEVPPDHATTTAERMIDADLRNMSGHGIYRLPSYVKRIQSGGYNLSPDIALTKETPVSALLDGDNGLGQVVMTKAVDTAVSKAEESGMAWIGVRRSNHAGAGGVYAARAAANDLIAIYMAIGNANHMAPWGGVDLLLSTNPIAIGIPAGEEPPILLDMATTVVSAGRIKVAVENGEEIPEGWLIDELGNPLTDPEKAHDGFLLPIGGYKGYGLNLAIGAMAGVLNGAAFGSDVLDFNQDFASPTNTGQALFVMRPDLFRPLDEFKTEMDHRIGEIKDSTPMEGMPPIRVPGDKSVDRIEDMRANGVPVSDSTVGKLRDLASSLGLIDHPFQDRTPSTRPQG